MTSRSVLTLVVALGCQAAACEKKRAPAPASAPGAGAVTKAAIPASIKAPQPPPPPVPAEQVFRTMPSSQPFATLEAICEAHQKALPTKYPDEIEAPEPACQDSDNAKAEGSEAAVIGRAHGQAWHLAIAIKTAAGW